MKKLQGEAALIVYVLQKNLLVFIVCQYFLKFNFQCKNFCDRLESQYSRLAIQYSRPYTRESPLKIYHNSIDKHYLLYTIITTSTCAAWISFLRIKNLYSGCTNESIVQKPFKHLRWSFLQK